MDKEMQDDKTVEYMLGFNTRKLKSCTTVNDLNALREEVKKNRDKWIGDNNKKLERVIDAKEKAKIEIENKRTEKRLNEGIKKILVQIQARYEELKQQKKSNDNKVNYDFRDKYDENLLSVRFPASVVKTENTAENKFYREDGTEVSITRTGEIRYTNFSSVKKDYISEYNIVRNIKGQRKEDTIYSDIIISNMGIDRTTNKPINPEYYNFVMNEMLSEDSIIECVKYNHGYVGDIDKSVNKEREEVYQRRVDSERLSAVMKAYGEHDKNHKKEIEEHEEER